MINIEHTISQNAFQNVIGTNETYKLDGHKVIVYKYGHVIASDFYVKLYILFTKNQRCFIILRF